MAVAPGVDTPRARRARLRLLEAAVARLSDMVVITEPDPTAGPAAGLSRIVFVNPAFEQRTGWRLHDVLGQSPRLLHGPDTDAATVARIADALARPEPVRAEVLHYTRGGEAFWVELDAVPLLDDTGRPAHCVAVHRDISDRKRLQHQHQALQQSQRLEALGQLTGGVAHDFNNLLTVMLGHGECLADRLAQDGPGLAHARAITDAAQRGAALTQRLLAVSRQQVLAPRVVDVALLLTGLEELLRRTLGEPVAVVLDIAPDVAAVQVDPAQLEAALLALAVNARDAMPQGGRLVLAARNLPPDAARAARHPGLAGADGVAISLSDTGCGIAPELLPRVFEPFFSTRPAGQGTGLGLAMVHGFMQQSGGAVEIESTPGRGTTVRLLLPRIGQAMDDATAPVQAGIGPSAATDTTDPALGRGRTVLLVEDDEPVRAHALAQLQALGWHTLHAADAAEALALLQEHAEVALLFTDVVMPGGMDGRALAQAARERRPGLPVLFTSGYTAGALAPDRAADTTAPASVLLPKPYLRADLVAALQRALQGAGQSVPVGPADPPAARPPAICPGARLLVLDDDPAIGLTLQLMAESLGAQSRLCTEPADFFDAVADWAPTHLCIDLNMPAMDGLAVLAELGRRGCRAQVIISSGVGQRVLDAASRNAAEHGLVVCGVLAKPPQRAALCDLLRLPGPAPADAPVPTAAPRPGAPPRWQPDLQALDQALARGELEVHYQPLVDCSSGHLHGLEALVRWRHPVHGLIVPDRFIALAEEHGRIDALTLQVLQRALDWFVPWRARWPARAGLTLSVNLSALSLRHVDFAPRLRQLCDAAGMAPGQMVFELTETRESGFGGLTLELLTRLRVQGFELSLDDFGRGYGALMQLRRLPFSEIKIDREFVAEILHSPQSEAIVRFTVELGHRLGLRCVAEGIEDAETLERLRRMGCELAQGYLFSRPLPAAEIEAWALAREEATLA